MKLTLVRGIPGSGKSTKARELAETFDIVRESDEFFMVNGEYKFNVDHLGDAHRWCQSECAYWLYRGFNVFVSNTSIFFKDINCYYKIANLYGAEFEIVNCTGAWDNLHNVPEAVLTRMKKNFKPITTEEWIEHRKSVEASKYEYF